MKRKRAASNSASTRSTERGSDEKSATDHPDSCDSITGSRFPSSDDNSSITSDDSARSEPSCLSHNGTRNLEAKTANRTRSLGPRVASEAFISRSLVEAGGLPSPYRRIERYDSRSYKAKQLLFPSNFEGKEVWHIVAPSSLPMTSLRTATVNKFRAGDMIVRLAHDEFEFSAQKDLPGHLLAASDDGSIYGSVLESFSQSCSVKRIVKTPITPNLDIELSEEHRVVDDADKTSTRAIHSQPHGLRTRHWPRGFEQC